MEPNPYESPESLEDEQYEPPWDDEAEKASRKKWGKALGIFALVVFLSPFIGVLVLMIMGVVDLLVYIVYRLVTGK
jgi:hypothetical protein